MGHMLAAKVFEGLSDREKQAIESLRSYNDAPLDSLLKYVYSKYSRSDLEQNQ
jgi:hypothetical protein